MFIDMETITSRNNPLIKDTKKLLTSSKERAKSGLFVLEGARLCFDLLRSDCPAETVLMTAQATEKYPEQAAALCERAARAFLVSEEVAWKLSETESTQGVFAVCRTDRGSNRIRGRAVVALDRVQDPANLGAIIRSAEAFGIDTLITYACCDVYNPKALRASMGGALRVNIVQTDDLTETLRLLEGTYRRYATVPDRAAAAIGSVDFTKPSVCVIGNEANGVEPSVLAVCDERITIPMRGNAESLNAGAACAVTMWEMCRV